MIITTMIPVVRDDVWQSCLKQACEAYKKITPDEKCMKFADASWRLKKRYQKYYSSRKTIVKK